MKKRGAVIKTEASEDWKNKLRALHLCTLGGGGFNVVCRCSVARESTFDGISARLGLGQLERMFLSFSSSNLL